jgi:hypothetical protein
MKTKMRIEIPDEKERELPPPGSHIAACFAVVDLGTQNTPYGAKHQVYLSWELRKRNSQGTQHQIGKFYTLTNDARGTLRQDLSGWFGHELEDHEFKGFDLLSLIGRTARINVIHKANQAGDMRARVNSIALPDDGVPAKVKPATAPMTFGMADEIDFREFDALPQWLRDIISRSPQFQNTVDVPFPPSDPEPEGGDRTINGAGRAAELKRRHMSASAAAKPAETENWGEEAETEGEAAEEEEEEEPEEPAPAKKAAPPKTGKTRERATTASSKPTTGKKKTADDDNDPPW